MTLKEKAIKGFKDGNVEVWVTSETETVSIRRAKYFTIATDKGFWSDVLGVEVIYLNAKDVIESVFDYLQKESEIVEIEYLEKY